MMQLLKLFTFNKNVKKIVLDFIIYFPSIEERLKKVNSKRLPLTIDLNKVIHIVLAISFFVQYI